MSKVARRWERRKRPVQRRSRETVDFVLEAAAQLFGELGYEGATTNHVAERAGVSIGSVYQYFPNKQALLLALAERHLYESRMEACEALRELREEGSSPEEFFRGFVGYIVESHRGSERLHDVFFVEAPQSERLVALVDGIKAACAKEIEDYLRQIGYPDEGLELRSRILSEICGTLSHDLILNPPSGQTSEACTEELISACLGYLQCSSELVSNGRVII